MKKSDSKSHPKSYTAYGCLVEGMAVCEGYSKAFQYLCDLSSFKDKVECHSVSGVTSGPHMWNVVAMEDGYNYLVDVTNCDEGTVRETLSGAAGIAAG